MSSVSKYSEMCDFVWQYEKRKKWHSFSTNDMQLLNEAVKQGECSIPLPTKKQKITLNLNKMCQINDVTRYEQRIRCLITNSGLYAWLWRNDKSDWVSFVPQIAFLLEVAYQKKELKLILSNYEFDLENFEMICCNTNDSQLIKRESIDISTTSIEDIIEKSKEEFAKACCAEFSSLKRLFDNMSPIPDVTSLPNKKRRKGTKANDENEDVILPVPGISKIKDNLGSLNGKESTFSDVPVDAECPIRADFHVYSENTAFSATLNQTNLQNNNNKFYFIQLLKHNDKEQYYVWRRWGRVGQRGQTSLNKYGTSLSEAKIEFEGKFYDKTRNNWSEADSFIHVKGKYDLLQINLAPQEEARKIEIKTLKSRLANELLALMELICDTRRMEEFMKEMCYDSNKTPLGQLTSQQVKMGYAALNKIAVILQRGGSSNELVAACNDFYTKIPHNFGMKRPPIIRTSEELDQKQEMLEALINIRVAMKVMNDETDATAHPLDRYYKSLNCSLNLVEPDSLEFKEIQKCLLETHGPTHNSYEMEIVSIFKCFKPHEEKAFINHENKLLLWHGSRIINWLGILKDGLRIAPPEAPKTGYMFGKGIYFADVSSKSANYCYATKKKNEGLLIMCEVSVGKPYPLYEAEDKMPELLPQDFDTVIGKGRLSPSDFQHGALSSEAKVPVGPLLENPDHAGSLQYNEYIVYSTKRVKMRYLVRIKFNYK
ncbi:poly [ADP-ribose] polymerase 2 isoform X1 [Parasteatoda tepidariorum]|uniref:poly [ADP-ribose] polymerase 2 isoform X1 n=1 Tax=Parasteatoda tepidariorum TaxID=114398 RepID=UPI001C721588|nr:poly [ADP-ribose] polymerase 2 [Parasteatoda tepidariorum]